MERTGHVSRARLHSAGAAAVRAAAVAAGTVFEPEPAQLREAPLLDYEDFSDARQLAVALGNSWTTSERNNWDDLASKRPFSRSESPCGDEAMLRFWRQEDSPSDSVSDDDMEDIGMWQCRSVIKVTQGGGLSAQLASRISAVLQTSDSRDDTARQLQMRLSIESGTPGTRSAYSGEEIQAEVDRQLDARQVLADKLRWNRQVQTQDAPRGPVQCVAGATPTSLTPAKSRLQRSREHLNTLRAQQLPAGRLWPVVGRESYRTGHVAACTGYGYGYQAGVQSDAYREGSCAHTETHLARLLVGKVWKRRAAQLPRAQARWHSQRAGRAGKRVAIKALARPLPVRTIAHIVETCQKPGKVPNLLKARKCWIQMKRKQQRRHRMKLSRPHKQQIMANVMAAWDLQPSALPSRWPAPHSQSGAIVAMENFLSESSFQQPETNLMDHTLPTAGLGSQGPQSKSAFHRWAQPQCRGAGGLGPSQKIMPFQGVRLRTIKRRSRERPALPLQMQDVLGVAREVGLPEPVLEAATEQLVQTLGGSGGGHSRQMLLSHPVPHAAGYQVGHHAAQDVAVAMQVGHGGKMVDACQVDLPKAVHEKAERHVLQTMGDAEESKPGLRLGICAPVCKAEPAVQAVGEHVRRMLGEVKVEGSSMGLEREESGSKWEMMVIES